MSGPTTVTIIGIHATSDLTDQENTKLDTSAKVQERIDTAISEIGDDFVLLHPEESSGVQEITGNEGLKVGGTLQSTGNFNVGSTETGANAKVWGTLEATGATTSGGALTVSSGGATITTGGLTVSAGGAAITGNSTVTGTLTSSNTLTVSSGGAAITGTTTSTGNLTVGATGQGNGADAYVYGDITATGTISGTANIIVPSSGGGLTFTVV